MKLFVVDVNNKIRDSMNSGTIMSETILSWNNSVIASKKCPSLLQISRSNGLEKMVGANRTIVSQHIRGSVFENR